MADSTRLETDRYGLAEADELRALARQLVEHNEFVEDDIDFHTRVFDAALVAASHPVEAEQAAETFARSLRRIWLEAAAHEAASVFRSPTKRETQRIGLAHDAFGYERDLQPETLEAAVPASFPRHPPAGARTT